jgi:hypothetical protein
LKAGIRETLDKADLAKILKLHNVNGSESELRSSLENGLPYYVTYGPYGMHTAIKQKALPRKRQLERMAKMAKELKAEYDSFASSVWGHLHFVAIERDLRVKESTAKNKYEKVIEEAGEAPFLLSQLLELLPEAIDHELADKHPNMPGRPKERGLRHLVRSLAFYWERHQGRDFTVDHNAGAAISDSLVFVRDCVQAVDQVPETAIISAGRAVRDHLITYKKHDDDEIPFLSADW